MREPRRPVAPATSTAYGDGSAITAADLFNSGFHVHATLGRGVSVEEVMLRMAIIDSADSGASGSIRPWTATIDNNDA